MNPPHLQTQPASVGSACSGLRYGVAQTLEQATAAWELVYRCYLRAGLIDANAEQIHTLGRVVGPDTAVVCGAIDRLIVSTLSVCLDRPDGLPSDSLFGDEIGALRRKGGTVFEMGLFADRRERLFRSVDALLELMRYAMYFGVHHQFTDALYAAHPDQASMLGHLFGFEVISGVKPDPRRNHHPTVLLRLNWPARSQADPLPGGLEYFLAQPVGVASYSHRFDFSPQALRGSSIAAFCNIR